MSLLMFPNGNRGAGDDAKRLTVAFLVQLMVVLPVAVLGGLAPAFAILVVVLTCSVTGGYAIAQGKAVGAPMRGLVVMVVGIAIAIGGALLVRPV